jgi:hypothetical protein
VLLSSSQLGRDLVLSSYDIRGLLLLLLLLLRKWLRWLGNEVQLALLALVESDVHFLQLLVALAALKLVKGLV